MLKCFKSHIMFKSSLCISIAIYRCFQVAMLRCSLQSCTSFEDRISVTNSTDVILYNLKMKGYTFRFLFRKQNDPRIHFRGYLVPYTYTIFITKVGNTEQNICTTIFLNRDVDIQITYYLHVILIEVNFYKQAIPTVIVFDKFNFSSHLQY